MAYFQVLAIVLCACFIQDAFSVAKDPTNNAASMRSPVRRTTTVRHNMAPRTAPAVQAPPPAKYPHLTAVKDMFWNAWEDLNRTNAYGKLGTRAVRNAVGGVLADKLFWSSLVSSVRRKVKMTNDKRRADARIRMCNSLTAAITSPMAVQGFQEVANEVYGTVTRVQSEVGTDALRLISEMVDGGEVTRGLDAIISIVTNVQLNPAMLVKGFAMLRKTLNLGGTVNMSGGVTKGLMSLKSFSSKLNYK